MYSMFKSSLEDFRTSFSLYLSFELIYSFLVSLIFTPFLMYVFNKGLMMLSKGAAIVNQDVFMVGLSFKGLIGLFLISFIAVAIVFIEYGVLIIIANKRYFKAPVLVSSAWKTAMYSVPKLLGLGIFQLIFLLLLTFPFLDASTLPPLLDINITILLTDVFQESLAAKLVYITILLFIMYLYTRWVYVLHFIFIENQSIWHALGSSWILTRQGKVRLVVSLILWNALIIMVGFLIVSLLSTLATAVDSKVVGDFIGNYLLSVSSFMTMILSLFFIPINVIILTRLFHRSLAEAGLPQADHMLLARAPVLSKIETKITRVLKRRRGVITVAIALILTVGFIVNDIVNDSLIYLPWDVEVAGHKGDGFSAPENSISSIRSGIKKGVDAVEIDVTLTKDDVLVLSHDLDLKRTAGISEFIRDLTYKELSTVDIGTPFDPSFAGETIPKLDEVLELTTKYGTNVIIDVKTDINEAIYAREITRIIRAHGAEDLSSVQSFNTQLLKQIRQHNSEIDIGQILYLSAGNLEELDVDFYTVRESMLTERFINRAKQKNRDVWVWTVNNKRNIKEVLSYDIDGIITDYPEKVQRMLGIELADEQAQPSH